MNKLEYLINDEWVGHTFPALYTIQTQGTHRIIAGVPNGEPSIFAQIASCLTEPVYLLYVLHTPRGEGAAGRYQSELLSQQQLQSFIKQYYNYLKSDARFDIWAYSPSDNSTVVWDRHNQLFAYGAIDAYEKQLISLGFKVGDIRVPAPHAHNYHSCFDLDAQELLNTNMWSYSELQPSDEQ